MTDQNNNIPGWFMPVAIIAVVWNLMGVSAFVMHMMMTPEAIAALPAEEAALYDNMPLWATVAFAVAVFAGALGSLLLVIKKASAKPILVLSLIGVLVQMYHSLFMSNSIEVYGPGAMVMPVMVIVIACLLVWMARTGCQKGWLL
ncbi:hypothetical protein [Neptunicella sp. SCSIO 80796]|uniref:hypothetical protein n=1 Tax=Neptunicella plasticusilytica TaxID=3117012 RepID=UPI003A4DA19D